MVYYYVSFSFYFFVFREDHHLLLQVQLCGFQGYASDLEHYRIQLLPQVHQERGEGVPAVGGK